MIKRQNLTTLYDKIKRTAILGEDQLFKNLKYMINIDQNKFYIVLVIVNSIQLFPLIDYKEEHPLNILIIFLTLVVLNEDKFIDCKEEHPKNIQKVLVNNLLNINLT